MADGGSSAAASSGTHASHSAVGAAANRRVAALGSHLLAESAEDGEGLRSLSTAIADMKREQHRMREERKRHAKELKNAQRRKRRLKTKARQLTNEDLLAVLLLRQEQTAGADTEADDAPSGSASASAAPAAAPAHEP